MFLPNHATFDRSLKETEGYTVADFPSAVSPNQ